MGSTVGGRMRQGTVEGTGASISIDLDFTPSAVYIMNIDDLCTMWWNASMADASGLVQVTAGTITYVVALGITPVRSTNFETDLPGFIIGADLDLNVTAQTIHWCAWE